jgi:colanic acid biosynthesis glycosyl transferase WcaI
MRVVIVSPVFPPEPVVSSRTSWQIAEALAAQGHAVTVITAFPNRPAGRLFPGYSRRPFRRETLPSGVAVIRCLASLSRRSRMTSRLAENVSFGVTSALALAAAPRPDVVYAITWPIFALALVTLVARARGVPLVSSIQDVYPESLVAQGRLAPTSRIVRWLRRLDGAIIRRSRAVILISETFRRLYARERGVPDDRLEIIPNWAEQTNVVPDTRAGEAFRGRLGVPAGATLAVYGGNVGEAAGVEMLIDAAQQLAAPDLYLLVAGEGSSLSACQARAARAGPSRVLFHHPWPASETSAVLSAADVLLLPTRGRQSLVSVPSKLLAYMLVGKPILATALPESDLARLMRLAGCGWCVEPDRPELLADGLRRVVALDDDGRRRLGAAGRTFVLTHLAADVCVPRVLELLARCAAGRPSYPASVPAAEAPGDRRS